jgi:transcription initiation factor TFIID subunit TAF12
MQMQIEVEQSTGQQQQQQQQQHQQKQQQQQQQQQQNVNIDSLKYLRDKVESLTVFHQTEILRILHTNKVTFSENKNGIFVNLTYVSTDVIDAINEYIIYVYKQESQLNEIEEKKIVLSNQYFK